MSASTWQVVEQSATSWTVVVDEQTGAVVVSSYSIAEALSGLRTVDAEFLHLGDDARRVAGHANDLAAHRRTRDVDAAESQALAQMRLSQAIAVHALNPSAHRSMRDIDSAEYQTLERMRIEQLISAHALNPNAHSRKASGLDAAPILTSQYFN